MTPPIGGGFAFSHRIVGERLVDANVHVRIDAARKGQKALRVEYFGGIVCPDFRRQLRDFAVLDADIEAVDAALVRPHHAGVLDR